MTSAKSRQNPPFSTLPSPGLPGFGFGKGWETETTSPRPEADPHHSVAVLATEFISQASLSLFTSLSFMQLSLKIKLTLI